MLARWRGQLSPLVRGSLLYFTMYGAYAVYLPFLSVYFAHKGLSGTEVGVLSSVGPPIALLIAPGIAALADRSGGRVRVLSLLLVGTALCLLLMPLPDTFATLLPVVVLLAIVFSPVFPLADALVAPLAAQHRLDFGRMRLWGSLSWAIIAAAGGAIWQQVGFWLMFPLASVLFVAAILVVQLLHEEGAPEAGQHYPLRKIFADRRMVAVLLATFVLGLCLAVDLTFSGVYLDRLSGQMLVGVFVGVGALCELPAMRLSGRIIARLSGPGTLVLACVLLGCAYLGLALVKQTELLPFVAVLRGLGFGLLVPSTVRMVAGWAPPGLSATYQGLLNAGMRGLAPLIAGPIAGSIFDTAGPEAVFLAAVAATVLAGLIIVAAQLGGVFKAGDGATPGPQSMARQGAKRKETIS